MSYGDRVRRLLKSMKKNQDELSAMVGLSRQSLYRVEKNKSEIGIEFLNKIGQYSVDTEWLIMGEGEMFRNNYRSLVADKHESLFKLSINYEDKSLINIYGDRIKEIRSIKGMAQGVLAKFLNTSQSNLFRYENNTGQLNADKLQKFYQLGININWLLTGQGEMFRDYNSGIKTIKNNNLPANIEETIYVKRLDIKVTAGFGFMNLKSLRKEKGYTQEELSDIETGKVTLTERLRTALGELGIHIVEEKKGIISLEWVKN